ncbi:hypothetical protein D3C87_1391630 [compost metagenome]
MAKQTMRMVGEAITRKAGIENGDFSAGTTKLESGGKPRKTAADNDDVIHGDRLRVVAEGTWVLLFGYFRVP